MNRALMKFVGAKRPVAYESQSQAHHPGIGVNYRRQIVPPPESC